MTGDGHHHSPIDLPDLAEIRVIRKQLGWTQRELAKATGLSQSFINNIERNEADPGYRTAKKVFQTLSQAVDKRKTTVKNKTALDVMAMNVESVTTSQTLEDARKLMLKNDFSQLPVIDNGLVKGSITDRKLMSLDLDDMKSTKIRIVMERKFPIVDPDTK
jgi:predicted transcriptional regulator